MESQKLRRQLAEILGKSLKFNREFDPTAERLKEGMQNELVEWCRRCKENKELGSVPPKKEFRDLYIFFRKIASDVRVTLIKVQNSDFIEIHLSGHKEYDDARMKYGYKKSSYYGS
ncbi:hypothetical protein HYU14_06205 [Candidatus Woesearchaeota archaeon]|nr:hypothetical protein [Candidatus Woesearchaeota archaeon]